MLSVKLALDWTPNINHIGFFISQKMGFYKDEGVTVDISDPSQDNYALTPVKKVELGQADFALCPTESLISYKTKSNAFDLTAVAAVLQEDLSAIAVKQNSEIKSPRDLDGKVYASYKAKYEDEIIRQMMKNDGGEGELKISYPNKLGIWETVLENKADATWIFLNWEGIAMQNSETKMRYFCLEDYHIPYSYSPVLVAASNKLASMQEAYKRFVKATKRGFEFAVSQPQQSLELFAEFVPENDKHINLTAALEASMHAFTSNKGWGYIELEKVESFFDWLKEHELESADLTAQDFFTNQFLSD